MGLLLQITIIRLNMTGLVPAIPDWYGGFGSSFKYKIGI